MQKQKQILKLIGSLWEKKDHDQWQNLIVKAFGSPLGYGSC